MDYIFRASQEMVARHKTRDPYELLDCIGAVTRFTTALEVDDLKGFAMIENRIRYAVINNKLDEYEQRIVAGHEAAHLILHENAILQSPHRVLQDLDIYCNRGRLENEANRFLADFLSSDEDVLYQMKWHKEYDYFDLAKALYLPPPLLAFKLYSMMQRGLPVRNPVELKSDFLKQ